MQKREQEANPVQEGKMHLAAPGFFYHKFVLTDFPM